MGLKIGSAEWVKAYEDALNNNPAYKEAAKTWEGDFVFVITPDGNLDHEIRFWMDLWHGDCRASKSLQEGDEQEAEYVVTGTYSNYLQVINKEVGPVKALMMGKLKLQGKMAKVLRAVEAAKQLVATIGNIDTEFY